jgi:kynurenine aminotransferase
MVYDGNEHVRIASLPGMWERTLTVGSGGSELGGQARRAGLTLAESFAATGWRVGKLWLLKHPRPSTPHPHTDPSGWLIGPSNLTTAALAAHTKIVFCTSSPMQEAIAMGFELAEEHQFFQKQNEAYIERRDVLTSYFDKLGLSYTKPEGSYFVLVDMSPVTIPDGFELPETCKGRGKDFALCWWLAQEIKVVAIPPSEVG